MVNHVPDAALSAVDEFGEGVLRGRPRPVAERLRSDLRLRVDATAAALAAGQVEVAFLLEATTPAATLRDHGPFVTTVVDGIDDRLTAWGVDPPPAYDFEGREDGWCRYAGTARVR